MKKNWSKIRWKIKKNKSKEYESKLLKLNSSKAEKYLNWKAILQFKETAQMTAKWYKEYYKNPSKAFYLSKQQILDYSKRIDKIQETIQQKK